MPWLEYAGLILLSYLIGSIPFGWIIVKITTGKDIRNIESGRTGGTNAMRAAGCLAGAATAVLDFLKGAAVGWWIANYYAPTNYWLQILAPIAAVMGHNYSIYFLESRKGALYLRGGAGGAPAFGGIFALYQPSLFILLPIVALVFVLTGYASLTTISIGLGAILLFVIRSLQGVSPWEYILYGVAVELIVLWALRPNLVRLIKGNERRVNIIKFIKQGTKNGKG